MYFLFFLNKGFPPSFFLLALIPAFARVCLPVQPTASDIVLRPVRDVTKPSQATLLKLMRYVTDSKSTSNECVVFAVRPRTQHIF